MKKMLWLLERLFGRKLARQTKQHLMEVVRGPSLAAREQAGALLRRSIARLPGSHSGFVIRQSS